MNSTITKTVAVLAVASMAFLALVGRAAFARRMCLTDCQLQLR